jgi:hypothetical protein
MPQFEYIGPYKLKILTKRQITCSVLYPVKKAMVSKMNLFLLYLKLKLKTKIRH